MVEDPLSESPPTTDRCRDRGSASLQVVLLTPIVVVLMFAGWQAALWNHARTNARVIARETAVLVARDRLPIGQAVTAAKTSLANTDLAAPDVDIVNDGERVTVTISGDAPGILRGTSSHVTVHASVPATGWVPL